MRNIRGVNRLLRSPSSRAASITRTTTTTNTKQRQIARYTSTTTNQGHKTAPPTINTVPGRSPFTPTATSSSSSSSRQTPGASSTADGPTNKQPKQPPLNNKNNNNNKKKTMAELDEELRLAMEGMSGEGGSAGVEYEDGKAEGLKRGVKANMFRVI